MTNPEVAYDRSVFRSIYDVPTYKTHTSIAYTMAGVFYLLGVMFFGKCTMAKRYWYLLVSLISIIMGSAFIARGIFAVKRKTGAPSYIASNVLIELGSHLTILMNYILLLRLLNTIVNGPRKRVIRTFRAFAFLVAIVFGSLACAGITYVSRKNSTHVRLGARMVRASVVAQVVSTLVLLILASWSVHKYKEVRNRRLWFGVVVAGGILILARNIVRIVIDFHPRITLLRRSEAAWYTLNPLFILCCVVLWTGASIPRRCHIQQ
ncbi:hypothetical protein GQ54DRAFT_188689 [Martensiomyces pterosporus]|nr:hypothetical protein GQ54DRAFT_188689 [Martensiomyces pterosporus]